MATCNVIQLGINKLIYHTPPVKPKFEDCYDTKPIIADYKPGGKLNPKGTNKVWRDEYKDDLRGYKSDIKDFEARELEEWKEAMSEHNNVTIEDYCGVNYYHSWCKNEQ